MQTKTSGWQNPIVFHVNVQDVRCSPTIFGSCSCNRHPFGCLSKEGTHQTPIYHSGLQIVTFHVRHEFDRTTIINNYNKSDMGQQTRSLCVSPCESGLLQISSNERDFRQADPSGHSSSSSTSHRRRSRLVSAEPVSVLRRSLRLISLMLIHARCVHRWHESSQGVASHV